jgi:hypothetical protein
VPPILNVAAYRFVELDDLPSLRSLLLQRAEAAALKGTVLLAPEGINLFLAGAPAAVRGWLQQLQADPRFAGLEVKDSYSAEVPFRRLRVRIKREIIRMNQPAIRPVAGRAPSVDAPTLARWLSQGHCDAGPPSGDAGHAQRLRGRPRRLRQAPSTGGCTSSASFRVPWPSTCPNCRARPSSATAPAASAARRPPSGCASRAWRTRCSSTAAS